MNHALGPVTLRTAFAPPIRTSDHHTPAPDEMQADVVAQPFAEWMSGWLVGGRAWR